MARIKNPITFSKAFGLSRTQIDKLGILDPVLNVDTKLFIDPLLLENSKSKIISSSKKVFDEHFGIIIKLLNASKKEGDVAWKGAKSKLQINEVSGICLGYGSATISGKKTSTLLSDLLLNTAKEIISIGVNDPDLFLALSLLEEGIGPDTISDMTANVIYDNIASFTNSIASKFNIPLFPFFHNFKEYFLPRNPLNKKVPVLLVPKDILRKLPIARDWEEVCDAARHNELLRHRVNNEIGNIWAANSKKRKKMIRNAVLKSKTAFQTLIDTLHSVDKNYYDFENDSEGLITWLKYIHELEINPLDLSKWKKRTLTIDDIKLIVKEIVTQFKLLIEHKGLWKELWAGNKNRPEKSAQRLFFAVADSYCKANDLDLSPEADSGTGPVDFKISLGSKKRVLVELKLSTNSHVISGFSIQLETYKKSEETYHATYVVIDLGDLGKKESKLLQIRNDSISKGEPCSDLIIIDGKKQDSASKRTNKIPITQKNMGLRARPALKE